jgi:hypothetical protein
MDHAMCNFILLFPRKQKSVVRVFENGFLHIRDMLSMLPVLRRESRNLSVAFLKMDPSLAEMTRGEESCIWCMDQTEEG